MVVASAFRRSVVADTKKKGGKGGKGSYYDRWRIPAAPAPAAPFILMPKMDLVDPNPAPELVEVDPATGRPKPVLVPYYKVQKHKRKVPNRPYPLDCGCSRGWNASQPQPCVGCYAQDSGDKSVGLSDVFVFPLVHLGYYHGHPMIDRQTRGVVMKQDGSGPVIIYDECTGRTCNYCRILNGQPPFPPTRQGEDPFPMFNPRDITTIFGKRRYMEIGRAHLGDLEGFDQSISATCGTCRSQLTTDAFVCPHCNSTIIDMANDPRSDEQIAQDVLRPYPCMTCQRPVMLKEVVSCDTCSSQGRQHTQLSVFDVVIFGQRQGQDTKSHVVQAQPFKTIEEFAQTVDPRFLNGKTLREHIQDLAKPFDFEQIYKVPTLQEQAERLDLPLPPGAGGGPQYGAYPGQPGAYQQAPVMGQVPAGYGQPQPSYGGPPAPQGYAPAPQQGYTPAPQGYAPQQPPPGAPPFGQYPQQGQQPAQPGPQPFVPPGRPNFGQ